MSRPAEREFSRSEVSRPLQRMVVPGTEDLQLIVELSDPSVLERMQQTAAQRTQTWRGRKPNFSSAEAVAHRQNISRAQESLKRRIEALPGARVLGTANTLMNAVFVRIPASQFREMRGLAGVKKIYFARPRKLLLDGVSAIQNAATLWTQSGGRSKAGQGIRIGIIDSGIDISNPMFSGSGMSAPTGFSPKSSSMGILDTARMNNKVIVARSYVSSRQGQTAEDEMGHGTFVAGCAAGAQVDAPLATISGMAPGAYLGVYKIFSTGSIMTDAELAAIDDAVADGMDVINLSIGSEDYLPPEEDAEYQALTRAVQAGVVVTVSAGNSGNSTYTITSPATIPDVIAVGSVSNSHQFFPFVHTNAQDLAKIAYYPSSGPSVTSDQSLTKAVDISTLDGDGLGCSAFASGSLSNAVALIKRGTCTFLQKVNNAAKAGALSVIIYNNVAGDVFGMAQLESTTIPSVMISNADGIALKAYIHAFPATAKAAIGSEATLNPFAANARIVSSFSSVGPGTDFSVKPDVMAVGENVYSATERTQKSGGMYDASGFTANSGTSFSAPMVAGAAAGLLQKYPSLGPLAIKSLLTTTASRDLTVDGLSPANVVQAGSGVLDMGAAMAGTALFSPTSLNFGVHSYSGTLALPLTLTIQNISSSSDRFTFGAEPLIGGDVITFSQESTGSIPSGGMAAVEVTMHGIAPATGGFQGFITVRGSSGSAVYRIPYWGGLYVPDPARVLQVSQRGTGSYSSIADAISAAQPGNVIEIADSATYSAGTDGIRVVANDEGLPLHGLTIRGAAGQNPVIQAAAGSTGIRIIGLQNVRLQKLQITGGYTGLHLWQPSTAVPFSVTVDQCSITGSSGDLGAAGIWIEGGGTVEITKSAVRGSSGPGISTNPYGTGAQLTVFGSTVTENGFDGLDGYGADVFISESTFTGNSGAGVYLENSSGTISGNTISQNKDMPRAYGDGLQVVDDSNVTIKSNLFDSNAEAGIALFNRSTSAGPAVVIEANTMKQNGDYGVYSGPAVSVAAERNLIEDNVGGVYLSATGSALLANNIIVRSTGSSTGDGIRIENATTARLVNNTIYKNSLYGVRLTAGTASIANSIVASNTLGNVQGVDSSAIVSSLTDTRDPQFVNPAADDFSLSSSSPAVDAGTNAVEKLPFLDYAGRMRIASASATPGEGTVDMGAVESSSAFPLIYPLILNGNESAIGSSFTTGIAFMNPGSETQHFTFAAFDANGNRSAGVQNPVTLNANGQMAILDYQMFGFDSNASARASVLGSSNTATAGFTLLVDPGFRKFATGVNASTKLERDLVFMRHQTDGGRKASYVLFNPGTGTANITARLRNAAGSTTAQQTAVVPAKGHSLLQFSSGDSAGYVSIQSDRPVSGIEIVGTGDVMAALGGFAPGSQARLFFPHFAVGGNYSTQVGIVNTSASSNAVLSLEAFDSRGTQIGSTRSLVLQPGEQLLNTITELFGIPADGPLQSGYLVARSDVPGIMGFTDFSYRNGSAASDATIPADSAASKKLLFSHIAHGVLAGNLVPYMTGIALLNPFGTDVGYTMSVYDGDGILKAQTKGVIAPRQKVSKILSYPEDGVGFFTGDLSLANGHIEVTTDYGLMGLELFFTEDVSQLASVPAQSVE